MPIRKTSYLFIKVIIVLSTYSYIFYKIYFSKEIAQFNFSQFNFNQAKVIILIAVFLLMGTNWLLEAIKWKALVRNIKTINIIQSLYSVLAGISIGIFTPNRIGEFAGRPYFLDKDKIVSGIAAAITGSFSQSLVTVFIGILAINFYLFSSDNRLSLNEVHIQAVLFFSIFLILIIAFAFFNPSFILKFSKKTAFIKTHEKELLFLASYKLHELFYILSLSFLRFLVFSFQFYLLLLFFGVDITAFHAFISIGMIYLFLYAIPGIALSEIGVRGSLAIFFIGIYSTHFTAILSATILLWIINLAIPAISGSFIVLTKSFKKNTISKQNN
jgi:hypothetical protein